MATEYEIRTAINIIWRNLPSGCSTFSTCCVDGCDQPARGGGKCLKCAEKELANLTCSSDAKTYVANVKFVRELEERMVEEYGE